MHVDEFIDDYEQDKYARWFFMLHRLSAFLQSDFSEWIKPFRLFCDYEEKKYRVTGASRLGDVWLTEDFNRETGYELRVDIEKCSNWKRDGGGSAECSKCKSTETCPAYREGERERCEEASRED